MKTAEDEGFDWVGTYKSEATYMSVVEAGKKGARKRWGPPRRIHIGDLKPWQREKILEFVAAIRAEDDEGEVMES